MRWEGGRREEHRSDELRQKIIDIICEQWPTPDGYLLGFDIYERLRSGGVEVAHYAVETMLEGLAAMQDGLARSRLPHTISPGDESPMIRLGVWSTLFAVPCWAGRVGTNQSAGHSTTGGGPARPSTHPLCRRLSSCLLLQGGPQR